MGGLAVRLKSQRLFEGLYPFGQLTAFRKGRTQVRVRTSIFRIERNSFPEFAHRAGEVPPLHERYTQPIVRLRRSGSDLDRPLEGLEGEREIVLPEINLAQPDQK